MFNTSRSLKDSRGMPSPSYFCSVLSMCISIRNQTELFLHTVTQERTTYLHIWILNVMKWCLLKELHILPVPGRKKLKFWSTWAAWMTSHPADKVALLKVCVEEETPEYYSQTLCKLLLSSWATRSRKSPGYEYLLWQAQNTMLPLRTAASHTKEHLFIIIIYLLFINLLSQSSG